MNTSTRTPGGIVALLARAVAVVGVPAAYFLFVFGAPADTALKKGLGDWMDPYFINYLLEHWYHSVRTLSDPVSPPMYFPAHRVLGYSHGLILYAPFYVAVRPFLHPFQAYNISLFLMLQTGSICLYLVLRMGLGLQFVEALLLSAFFFTSNNVINKVSGIWTQRMSVFVIPPIILLGIVSARMPRSHLRLVGAGMVGLLAALVFTQDFYTGALFVLVVALFSAGWLPLIWGRVWSGVVEILRIARSAVLSRDTTARLGAPSVWWIVVCGIAVAIAIAIKIHPIRAMAVGPWRVSARDVARPAIVAVVTGGWFALRRSPLWPALERLCRRMAAFATAVIAGVPEAVSPASDETKRLWQRAGPWALAFASGVAVGAAIFAWIYVDAFLEHPAFPADQLFTFLVALRPSTWRTFQDVLEGLQVYPSLRPFALAGVVVAALWIPIFRVDRRWRLYGLWVVVVSVVVLLIAPTFGNFSFWKTFFAPIPGLSVIRDPRRIIYMYELAVVLLTGALLSRLPGRAPLRLLVSLFVAVLFVAGWNPERFDFERPNIVFDRWVSRPIQIDPSCKSFFIKGASADYMARSPHMWMLYGVDAMFIALNREIPTLNGYSAWAPDGWELANPQEDTYPARVGNWIRRKNLFDVCALDIERRTMTPRTSSLAFFPLVLLVFPI
jgi:hypothetical protein